MMCGYKASFLSSTNTYPTVNSWKRSADYMTGCGDTFDNPSTQEAEAGRLL